LSVLVIRDDPELLAILDYLLRSDGCGPTPVVDVVGPVVVGYRPGQRVGPVADPPTIVSTVSSHEEAKRRRT